MSDPQANPPNPLDAIIIGAGIAGLYQLHRLRDELGLSVKVFEAGTDVGGTWYWNRYPGARFDSESYSYGYSFSKEILQEWDWKEHFSPQPETLRYVNFVADKLDLRKDIQFSTRVSGATFDDQTGCWEVKTETGELVRARFLITCIGVLSTPVMPNIEGFGRFDGPAFHTSEWPTDPIDFSDKRVAVIGTGATAVQLIPEMAKMAAHLTVFQRSPNYCAPLHNGPIDDEAQARIKASYDEIFEKCRSSHGGFVHNADGRYATRVSEEEREAFFEELYASPGFGIWMGNFRDILTDWDANATITDFVKRKIRERVNDPVTAEKLIPKDHGFGLRRVPLETGYYETYNRDNVTLVDLNDTPIERITANGIRTSDQDRDFDVIIYATGFDAVTGSFDRMDIRNAQGEALRDKWAGGPKTYLGLQTAGFPNLLTIVGPHNAATFCNIPRCIEQNVDWVTDLMRHMHEKNLVRIAATKQAEDEWTQHVHDISERMLFTKVDSWFMGINKNLAHKNKRVFLLYSGGAPRYRERCDEVASNGYEGFALQ
jgi:cation diffusion facilitator CzcD-associated flavoprotein CzcO